MPELLRDFRYSVRVLKRSPGFSLVAVLVLAFGIGANTAVFSIVNSLLLQPRQGRIDSLVVLYNHDTEKPDDYREFSYPAYVELRDRSGVFDSLMAHAFALIGVRHGDATERAFAAVVSANYFATLGVPLAIGRPFSPAEERPGAGVPVAIASYAVWKRAGLDPKFVGSTVRVNATDFTVIGVAPRRFSGTMAMISPEWWFPLGSYDAVVNDLFKQRATGLGDRGNYALSLVGALKPGVSEAAATRVLDAFAARLGAEYPDTDRNRAMVLGPVSRMSVSSSPTSDGGLSLVSALLMVMAGLVLVVACLNLANLLLARGAARRREIAIRQALGSTRRRIVQQLLAEGLTLSCAGAALGATIAWWTARAMAAWLGSALPLGLDLNVEPDTRVLAAAAGFAMISTMVFALGPAWSLSRPAVATDLKNEGAAVTRRTRTGTALVVVQLAVSLALVAAGGLFVRAAVNASHANPGFALDHQLVFSVDPSLEGYDRVRTRAAYRAMLDRVRSLPGVEHASFASMVPFGEISEVRTVKVPGAADGTSADFIVIGTEYFQTLGIGVLRGREFLPGEELEGAGRHAIVGEALARKVFGDNDPIGRTVEISGREGEPSTSCTVVGIVPTIMQQLFDLDQRAHIFVPYGAEYRAAMTIHVRTAPAVAELAMVGAVRQALQRTDSRIPVLTSRTMTMQRDASLPAWGIRASASLFSAFGVLALLLATLGVYGVKAYDVARRTREIGIRMALGATRADVAGLVVREGARATALGTGLGLLLAAALGFLLRGILYRVSPFDPLVVGAAAALLAGAALLASYVPARRATRVAPLDALRTE